MVKKKKKKGTDIQVMLFLIFLFNICKCSFSVMSYLRKNMLYFCNHFALAHIFLETLYRYMYKINMIG